jgi:hypothetical protein
MLNLRIGPPPPKKREGKEPNHRASCLVPAASLQPGLVAWVES